MIKVCPIKQCKKSKKVCMHVYVTAGLVVLAVVAYATGIVAL